MRLVRVWWMGAMLLVGLTGAFSSARADSLVVKDKTISTFVDWSGKTVHIQGLLSLVGSGHLKLDNALVLFEPKLEDTTGIEMKGNSLLEARNAVFRSGSGKQWNLEASGSARIRFTNTQATNHSGLRMHQNAIFQADGGDVEEVQAHDSAQIRLTEGSGYLVLFFVGHANAAFTAGQLSTGDDLTRTFAVPTGAGTARIQLTHASVYGWQIDLNDAAAVRVAGGRDIVLALHLTSVVRAFSDNLTSAMPGKGAVAFGSNAPAFTYQNTSVVALNVYAGGASRLTFNGATTVIEPNAFDTAVIIFGPKVRMAADLAQTYDSAKMVFNGVTLVEDGSFPSFTAQDDSRIELNKVRAPADARAYAQGKGQVRVVGGFGWNASMCEAIDPEGSGGVYLNGKRVAP